MVEVIDRDRLGFRVSGFRVLGFVPDKQGVIAYYFGLLNPIALLITIAYP